LSSKLVTIGTEIKRLYSKKESEMQIEGSEMEDNFTHLKKRASKRVIF